MIRYMKQGRLIWHQGRIIEGQLQLWLQNLSRGTKATTYGLNVNRWIQPFPTESGLKCLGY
jgi:hypothetical protein